MFKKRFTPFKSFKSLKSFKLIKPIKPIKLIKLNKPVKIIENHKPFYKKSSFKSNYAFSWRRPEKIKDHKLYNVIYLQTKHNRTQTIYELRSDPSVKYRVRGYDTIKRIKEGSPLYNKLWNSKHRRFEPLGIFSKKVFRKKVLNEKNLLRKRYNKFLPKKKPGHLFRKKRFLRKYQRKLIKLKHQLPKKNIAKKAKKYRKFIPKSKIGYLFRKKRIRFIQKKKNIKAINRRLIKSRKLRKIRRNSKFKYNLIFMKKLFTMFIKKGLKQKIIKFYAFFIAIINRKIRFNKLLWNVYIAQIVRNILPLFDITLLTKRGEKIVLPWLIRNKFKKNKKALSVSCNWIKKAVLLRKEKTLFLKIISELESIRQLGNSQALTLKNEYYTNFYKNKYFIKFLKKREWI